MPQTSNGVSYDLIEARWMHTYIGYHGQSIELTGFQDGEKVSSKQNTATHTQQKTFEGNNMIFQSNDKGGTFTLTTVPGSHTNNLLDYLFKQSINADPDVDPTFSLTSVNDQTGQINKGEGCVIAQEPDDQQNSGAYTLAWTVLASEYTVTRNAPDISLG